MMSIVSANNLDLIVPSNDITLAYWDKIDRSCKPLNKLGITFFNYLKVYDDCTIADLNNAPEMTEYFYYKSTLYQSFSPLHNNKHFEQGFMLDKSLVEQDLFNIMRDKFNIDHVIFFIEKQPNATVFWQFGTQAGNDCIINFYLNNTVLLKKFCSFFSYENRDILALSEKNKYKICITNKSQNSFQQLQQYDSTVISSIYEQFDMNSIQLSSLTPRERECLHFCVQGLSAKEIALTLNISNRTVETHIANIKKKLKCIKLSKLISKISPLL